MSHYCGASVKLKLSFWKHWGFHFRFKAGDSNVVWIRKDDAARHLHSCPEWILLVPPCVSLFDSSHAHMTVVTRDHSLHRAVPPGLMEVVFVVKLRCSVDVSCRLAIAAATLFLP